MSSDETHEQGRNASRLLFAQLCREYKQYYSISDCLVYFQKLITIGCINLYKFFLFINFSKSLIESIDVHRRRMNLRQYPKLRLEGAIVALNLVYPSSRSFFEDQFRKLYKKFKILMTVLISRKGGERTCSLRH